MKTHIYKVAWTPQERKVIIDYIKTHQDQSFNVNIKEISKLLPNRTKMAIEREWYSRILPRLTENTNWNYSHK